MWLQEDLESAHSYWFSNRSQKISVSLRMIKWVLSCLEGKGLLKIGVLAFDMSHAGAGLRSMYVMGSARKGDTLTLGQTLVPGSARSSRPTASPQIPNREWGLQNPALAPAGAEDTTPCPSTRSQSRDQQCWQAGTGQGPCCHHY